MGDELIESGEDYVTKRRGELTVIAYQWTDVKIQYDFWNMKRWEADTKCRALHEELDKLQHTIDVLSKSIARKEMEIRG